MEKCEHKIINSDITLYNDPEGLEMIAIVYSCKNCLEELKRVYKEFE